jgi:hypothetical protein
MRSILICTVAALLASPVFGASGLSLVTYDDWQNALSGGYITPGPIGSPLLAAEADWIYGDSGYPVLVMESRLEVLSGYEGMAGLYMEWDRTPAEYTLASWRYTYGLDPNLTGKKYKFTIYPPAQCMYVSFAVADACGNWKIWDWHVGRDLTPGVASTLVIDPAGGAQGARSFLTWGNFDVKNIVFVDFDESARQTPPNPWGDPNVNWNVWFNVTTVPEPAAVPVVGLLLGLAGIAARRVRSRR